MSRTYRKDRIYDSKPVETLIKEEIDRYNRYVMRWGSYKFVKLTDEEYAKAKVKAVKETEEELIKEAKKWWADTRPLRKFFETGNKDHLDFYASRLAFNTKYILSRYRNGTYVYPKKRVEVEPNYDEVIRDVKERVSKRNRDGYCDMTNRNSGFKHDCKKSLRNKNKRLCKKVLQDEYDDGKVYPSEYEGKCKIWDWY